MIIKIQLKEKVQQALKSLEWNLFNHDVLSSLAVQAEDIILMRTKNGEFLMGSKTPAKYSIGHAQKRKLKKLPTSKVTLWWSGSMLEAIKQDVQQGSFEIGYLSGKSELNATIKASYFNELGAGRSKILYIFIGLKDEEQQLLIEMANEHVQDLIKQFNS